MADHNKFSRKTPLTICSLSDVDILFTDNGPPHEMLENCSPLGAKIIIV